MLPLNLKIFSGFGFEVVDLGMAKDKATYKWVGLSLVSTIIRLRKACQGGKGIEGT